MSYDIVWARLVQEVESLRKENKALSDERDSLKADKRLWQETVVKLGMAEDETARLREENQAMRDVLERITPDGDVAIGIAPYYISSGIIEDARALLDSKGETK